MITVKIRDKEHQVCSRWEDITIRQAAHLLSIRIPDSLKAVYDIVLRPGEMTQDEQMREIVRAEEAISFEDQHKNIPMYFSRVIEALSDIPGEVLHKTDVISIKTLYHTTLKRFVEGLHYWPVDYEPKQITCFDFQGQKYFLPRDQKVFGKSVPMVDMTALEFAESSDMMVSLTKMGSGKEFARAANLISILCRPDGEPYNEKISLARAEVFMDLPMNTVWDVFFSLIMPLIILGQYVQLSFLEGLALKNHVDQTTSTPSGGTGKSFTSQGPTSETSGISKE